MIVEFLNLDNFFEIIAFRFGLDKYCVEKLDRYLSLRLT
jgi:hypothetical protein